MKYHTRRNLKMYADDCGWLTIHDEGRTLVVFRWGHDEQGSYRNEVCMFFDAADRLTSLTQWQNRRISIDQEPQVRVRAEMLLMGRGR